MGGCPDIDTTRFRRAIWNYIYCIYGIRNDGYSYEEVTQLLQCQLRVFIKTATCYPERLNKTHTENALKHFELSEKVNVLEEMFYFFIICLYFIVYLLIF